MIFEDIFKDIVSSFSSLWTYKVRGNTLEIITPYASTNQKFISIFLTFRNNEYIVSDGGWLTSSEYEISLPFEEDAFQKILFHYENTYEIYKVEGNGLTHYYKKTSNPLMVSSLVFDMSCFISSIVSVSSVAFTDAKEIDSRTRFQSEANNFVSSIIPKERYEINAYLDEDRSIRLNVILRCDNNSKLILLNYITGSNINNFNHSIFKTDMIFGMANNSKYSGVIKEKIAVVNDKADGYSPNKSNHYLDYLRDFTKCNQVNWSAKDNLKTYLN